jgi:DNA-binding transcriptional MerR regulator
MDSFLDIADVAERTGLTTRALRFYEARGLVRALRQDNGRRLFGPEQLARVHAIVALKRAGFSLAQIQGLLDGRLPSLGRLVEAQLAELQARALELAETRALLLTVKSRIDRGEPLDVATLCSLIRSGNTTMETQNWQRVVDRYFTPEQQAEFAERKAQMATAMPGFDPTAYQAQWQALTDRIQAALPLDPAGAAAQAFYDEWQALLAPFKAVASPQMLQGTAQFYDRMSEWQNDTKPPFSAEVWQAMTAAGAARAAS